MRSAYGISWAYIGGDVAHEGYKAYWRNQRVLNPQRVLEKEAAAREKKAQKETGEQGAVASQVGEKIDLAKEKLGLTSEKRKEEMSLVPGKVPAIEDYRAVMAQRAVFQSLASMGLPAFTIHSIVRYSGKFLRNNKNVMLRSYGPIGVSTSPKLYSCLVFILYPSGMATKDLRTLIIWILQLGLAAVPALPYLFDAPVEHAVEWTFYNAFKMIGGPGAVRERPVTGKGAENKAGATKEKEL